MAQSLDQPPPALEGWRAQVENRFQQTWRAGSRSTDHAGSWPPTSGSGCSGGHAAGPLMGNRPMPGQQRRLRSWVLSLRGSTWRDHNDQAARQAAKGRRRPSRLPGGQTVPPAHGPSDHAGAQDQALQPWPPPSSARLAPSSGRGRRCRWPGRRSPLASPATWHGPRCPRCPWGRRAITGMVSACASSPWPRC